MTINDFTKDELNIIHLDMCTYVVTTKMLKESPSHKALREKVQNLINNYCDHKKIEFDGDVYGYSCKQCEKQFTEQVIDADRHYNIICGNEDND